MSFFSELKRRNVFKIAVAYGIVAWLLIQIVSVVLPIFDAPRWVVQTITFVILIGFPISLIITWAFELTPEGIKATSEVDALNSIRQNTGQKINAIVISSLVLAVLFMVVDNYVLEEDELVIEEVVSAIDSVELDLQEIDAVEIPALAISQKSIAVLPFVNLSSDPEQEYFSDGLTEELLNKLAQLQDLQVAARTSSFYFKGRNEDMREIGEILGVAHILEGSVRKSGNQIRITAQLIKADDGFHLWSETFDRELEDIFTIQDEIAEAVTTSLSVSLGAGEFDRPGYTRNVEAHDELLKAYSQWAKYTAGSVLATIDHLNRAVSLDPNFGLAWSKLPTAYVNAMNLLPGEQTREFRSLALSAIEQLKVVAPEMPELRELEARIDSYAGDWLSADQT